MSKNKWITKLNNMEGSVNLETDPNLNVIQTPSPSANWAFGNKGHGLPKGYTMLLGGPAKAGKSLISLTMIGQMHKDDPDAIAVVYNTEMRGELQANTESLSRLGVDKDRFVVFDTNQPDMIFDKISKDLAAMCDDGAPIRMIVIDSLSFIAGRRSMNSDTVMQQQIGDKAATIQAGLELILPVIRKHKIACVLLTHVRDEMDQHEIMRGNKHRLQAANATKHFAEVFAFVERNRAKAGRTDLEGNDFVDDSVKDLMGKGDVTGHKIRFKVLDTSFGVSGRTAEFTLDFEKGIINQHEEIFTLGINTGVIERPNNRTYKIGSETWTGIGATLEALKNNKPLQNEVLKAVYEKDL